MSTSFHESSWRGKLRWCRSLARALVQLSPFIYLVVTSWREFLILFLESLMYGLCDGLFTRRRHHFALVGITTLTLWLRFCYPWQLLIRAPSMLALTFILISPQRAVGAALSWSRPWWPLLLLELAETRNRGWRMFRWQRRTALDFHTLELERALLRMHRVAAELQRQALALAQHLDCLRAVLTRINVQPQSNGTDWIGTFLGAACGFNTHRLRSIQGSEPMLVPYLAGRLLDHGASLDPTNPANPVYPTLPLLRVLLHDEAQRDYQRLLRLDRLPSIRYLAELAFRWLALSLKLAWFAFSGCPSFAYDARNTCASANFAADLRTGAIEKPLESSRRLTHILLRGYYFATNFSWEGFRLKLMDKAVSDAVLDFVLRWAEWKKARTEVMAGGRSVEASL